MPSRIVFVSDDANFFEYISQKLAVRKHDELYHFSFSELPEKLHLLCPAVFFVNSEKTEMQTLQLLSIISRVPVIIFTYNPNDEFRINAYNLGAFAFITPIADDKEVQAILISALNIISLVDKNKQYKDILIRKNIMTAYNEVVLDYPLVLDSELERLKQKSGAAVLVAIAPDEKAKFTLKTNQLETIILNNIRENDILMNYAANKYFLLLYDTDIDHAKKIWGKINKKIPEKVYAGFAKILSKTRQQLINEVLNNLHEAINYDRVYSSFDIESQAVNNSNFKIFKQEYEKKIERVINPVFFHIYQKYNNLSKIIIEHKVEEGMACLSLSHNNSYAELKITSPGFSTVNIDITYTSADNNIDTKRITLQPNELESGLLEDLLEQFIKEFKEK